MKLQAFRIQNFKSIIDTKWCSLSPDNITGLIGQNESGKSSILEALFSFSSKTIEGSAFRNDETLPEISCSFKITADQFNEIYQDCLDNVPAGVAVQLENLGWRVNITAKWVDNVRMAYYLEEKSLLDVWFTPVKEKLTAAQFAIRAAVSQSEPLKAILDSTDPKPTITPEEFCNRFCQHLPSFELFDDSKSLLPDTIDYDDIIGENVNVEGFMAVSNFLAISNTSLEQLYRKAPGTKKKVISEINQKITADFGDFWTQKIGTSNKIEVSFDIEHYPAGHPKAGKCYLEFFVQDNDDPLHPKQRSQGVRWFLSFYLQLKASKTRNANKGYVLLIDEPGQSLHARAQEDVLRVFEDIKNSFLVLYTTHSPFLVDLSHLYRLLAVQRSNEEVNSHTEVISAMHLGSASTDTLTPVLTNMGVKIGHQNIIKQHNNVVLEEPSAYFYLSAFAEMFDRAKGFNFLPATGGDKIPQLVYLLTGWGVDCIVLVDNDKTGKGVREELHKNLFGADDALTDKKIVLLPDGCTGIEDIFSRLDFAKYIVEKPAHELENNSQFMKINRISKPITAAKFKRSVEQNQISRDSFSKETLDKISIVLQKLEDRFYDER